MATPDTNALAAYAGAYEQKIFSTLRNDLDIVNDVTMVPGIKNTLRLTKLTVGDGVRGYREAFDAADNDLEYSGRDLSVELVKRDILMNTIKYRSSYLSQVMKLGVNPDDYPYPEHTTDQIAKKIAQEINDGAYFAKKGNGSSVSTSFDGFGTIVGNLIGSGDLIPVATGAITSSNAMSRVHMVYKAMSPVFRKAGFKVFTSWDVVDKYSENCLDIYKKYTEDADDGKYYIYGSSRKVELVPCTWMGDSQRIIATPTENLLCGVDGLGDMDKIHTHVELEIIKMRVILAIGFQIRDLNAIKVNDQV